MLQQKLPRSSQTVTVSISLRTLTIIGSVLLAFWLLHELSSTLIVFAVAMLLATAIDKPASWLQRHRVPRGLAIFSIFMVLLGALALVVTLLVPLVSEEARELRENLPAWRTEIEQALNRFHAGNLQSRFSLASILESLENNATSLASNLTSVTLEAGHMVIGLFVTFVIAFMLAMNPRTGTTFAKRFLDEDKTARMLSLTSTIDHRIGGWVRGQVLVALSFGLSFGLGLGAIGIPFATTLGIIAALLEVVPYLGGAVTVLLATLIALSISFPHALAVIVLYVVLVNVESHILAPLLVGRTVGLPSPVVLGALFIGVEIKGIPGVLLAVPLVLVIAAILDEYWPGPVDQATDGRPRKIKHWVARTFRRRHAT